MQIYDDCTEITSEDKREDVSQTSPNVDKLNEFQSKEKFLDTRKKSNDENFQPNCELKNNEESETNHKQISFKFVEFRMYQTFEGIINSTIEVQTLCFK